MNQKKRRRIITIVAVILVIMLVLPAILGALMPEATAASSKQLESLKTEQQKLSDEKKRLENEKTQAEREKISAIQKKTTIDRQIEVTTQEINNTNMIIQELTVLIAQKEAELEAAVQDEAEQYQLFKTRVRVMEEDGDVSYVSILLSSDSFTDMLDRFEIINEVIESDRQIMRDLEAARTLIEERKAELEADEAEQQEAKNILDDRKKLLSAQSAEAQKLIDDLAAELDEFEKAFEAAEAEQKKVQQEITKMMEELARQSQTAYVGGTYMWPLPAQYQNITDPYGMRLHPTLKTNKLHTGTDIGAPKGTNIFAMNSGTVVTAGYNSGYGNYVVIDHGGGNATLYAHMSKIITTKGAKVKKGEVIGLVGSTGFSTGPHLHFEVIINGVQTDPMKQFTNK